MPVVFCLFLALLAGGLWAQEPERPLPVRTESDSQRADDLAREGEFLEITNKDYPSAIAHYRQALVYDLAGNRYSRILGDYARILNLYFYRGDYPDAMETATKGLALAESHHDTLQMAKYYNTIGFIYFRQGNRGESGKYYAQYLELSAKARDSIAMGDAYTNIGEVKAAGYHFVEALSSLFLAYHLYERLHTRERLMFVSNKISQVYKRMKNYDQAAIYSRKTLKDMETIDCNQYDKADYYINAGDIDAALSDLPEAVQLTRKGLAIAQRIRHREDIQDGWFTLAGIYAKQGRYDSAYFYYTLYSALKDSIINDQTRREIEEIHAHYAVDKKDKEILLQREQLARQGLFRKIIIISALSLIILILLLYNGRRLKQQAAYEARLNQQRNDLFGAVIIAQDNERKRIAQDIHDTVGSILSAAKLNLSALDEEQLPAGESKKYQKSLALLDEASSELRDIAHNIMPAGLSKVGLQAAVKGLLDRISPECGLKISYSVYGFEQRLSEPVEISIYRILSELIHNVIKHSGASRLTIQMIRYPRHINIVVEDNGKGFDQDIPAGMGKGMGLNNIRYRIEYLKGRMDIDSQQKAGTTVMIEIPC